jgi:hypothetical protein
MKIEFSGKYDDSWAKYTSKYSASSQRLIVRTLSDVLRINDWSILDSFNVYYDELNGEKRIIITKEEDESK